MKRRLAAAIFCLRFLNYTPYQYPLACYYIIMKVPLYSLILGILIIVSSQNLRPILATDINT